MVVKEILEKENREIDFDTISGTLHISKERDLYNSIKKKYTQIAVNITKLFSEKYDAYKNANDILNKSLEDFQLCADNAIIELKKDLISMDRYDLDDKTILEYIEKNEYFAPFYAVNDEICEKILAVSQDLEANKAYRQARKDNRSRWVGGTVGGSTMDAYVNQMDIGMRNAAEGVAHSMFNAVGNKFDKMIANSELKSIFNDKSNKAKMSDGVYNAIQNLHMTLVDLLRENTDIKINDIPSESDCETATRLLNNIESGTVPEEKINELYMQVMQLNPYNLDLYIAMMKRFGDSNKQLGIIAKYFDVGLDNVKDDIALGFIKENQGETEEDAISAKEKLVKFCDDISLDVSDELECMKYINQRLYDFDLAYRTVDGIECESRESADTAKEELPKIQEFMQQISAPTFDSLLDYEKDLLEKKEKFTELFVSELKDKYLAVIDKYLKDFDAKFCSMGIFKSGTRKEAGQFKAAKYAKGLKISSESEYHDAYEQFINLLPNWGITEEEAQEGLSILNRKKENIGKKGLFGGLFKK